MADLYTVETTKSMGMTKPIIIKQWKYEKMTLRQPIAEFIGPNAQTNAQKVCDLLNETSRSHGKHS